MRTLLNVVRKVPERLSAIEGWRAVSAVSAMISLCDLAIGIPFKYKFIFILKPGGIMLNSNAFIVLAGDLLL